jgi:hypothetical protein
MNFFGELVLKSLAKSCILAFNTTIEAGLTHFTEHARFANANTLKAAEM